MGFLHPWALVIGVAAVGLPLLVHWLTRPRPRRLPLSTMRFVREAIHQRRAIHRLRDWLILSLRAIAVALLAWAFSRPLLGDRRSLDTGDAGEVSRVVVLDVSASMSAVQRGIESFERGRSVAAEHLGSRPGLRAGLIFAGAQPRRVFESLSANLAELRRELAAARPRPEACDVGKALSVAADLLGKAPGGQEHRRELVVITDLQEANWRGADFAVLPADAVIRIESVAGEQAPANLAIVRAGAVGRSESGRPVRLEIEVGNYSDTPRNVTVDVTLAAASYRLEGLCPIGGTVVLTSDATLQDGGWQSGEARLVGVEDAVAADNARAFVVEVRPRPAYGLITREEASRRPSSSYFLERALSPESSRQAASRESVVRISPSQVNREMLAAADLLVIDRPGQLPADAINLLAALVVRGKSLMYVASEATDAINLKRFVQQCGSDLRMPVEFAPPSARPSRRGLTLASYRKDLPPFSVFGPQVTTAVEPLRFVRGLDSRAIEGGLKDDVLASYNDGTAGLVWTACGAGFLVVLNADLAESNLARSAAFVPMMGELSGHLLARRSCPVSHCGEAVTTWLPPEAGAASGLRVRGPSSQAQELGELVEEPAGVAWRWPSAGPPGVYEVLRDGQTVLAMATAVPAAESDLRPLSGSVSDRLAGGRNVQIRSASAGSSSQDDLWTWLGVACVAFMLVELLALRAFRT